MFFQLATLSLSQTTPAKRYMATIGLFPVQSPGLQIPTAWSLILFFMFLKAGLIMAFFMHLFWERYALVNVLLWPMTAIACFVGLMVAEGKYTVFSRLFYFFVGGA